MVLVCCFFGTVVLFTASVCEGLMSLFLLLLAKDCGPCFSYKTAKDCGPCLLLFNCKGLWSLSTAFFGTTVLFAVSGCKGLMSLFLLLLAKDYGPCFQL